MRRQIIAFSTKVVISSLSLCLAAWVVGFGCQCFAGSNFTVSITTLSPAGSKATSANYSDEATVGDIVGVSTGAGAGLKLKSGFIGQLYEARSLAVSAQPAAVVENGTTQLSAAATMDDASLVRLVAGDAKWSVQAGPLTGITAGGVATAAEVFINAPATVRARWNGVAGDLSLTVLNANVTTPGAEAEAPSFLAQVFQPGMAGLYHGLLKDGSGQVVGVVTGFMLESTRGFTAKVIFNGVTYSLAGALQADGSFSGDVKRAGRTPLTVTLQLGSTAGGGWTLQGTVSGDGTTGGGFIAHAPFSKTTPVPEALVRSYTFLVPATATGNTLLPEGDGFGSAKLTALGTITAAGRTGDGVAFTAGGLLTQDRQWHLFQPLYKSRGQLAGVLTFRDVPEVSDVDGGLRWVKNPNVKNKSYPGGFQLAPTLVGAVYRPPLAGQRALTELADQPYNARLTLAGTVLPEGGFAKTLSWLATNKLAYYGPETLAGTTTTNSGLLTGRYKDPVTKLTVPFAGAVLQKQGLAGGNFLVNNQAGYLLIEPGTNFGYPGSESAGPLQRVALPETGAGAPTPSAVAFAALAAGSYGGLLTHGGDLTGGLESVVISKTGALSGTAVIFGKRHAFKGTFGADGAATVVIARTGLPNIIGSIQLALADGTTDGYHLTGSFSDDGTEHAVDAVFYPTYPKTVPAPQAGRYTMAMRAPDAVDAAMQPGGDGYASFTVSTQGGCTGVLVLADGVKVTLSGRVSRPGEWLLHRSLYGGTGGFVAGKMTFREVTGISDLDGRLRWRKPPGVAATTNYAAGFDATRRVVGCRYTPPLKNQRAFPGLADRLHNTWLRLIGPDMSTRPDIELTTLDRAVTWTAANKLLHYGPDKIALNFTPATGLVTGSCADDARGVKVPLGGVLLQKQGRVTGFYAVGANAGLMVMQPR